MAVLPSSFSMPPLQEIQRPETRARDLSLQMLRLDQMHPSLGGNKWFKLKNNIHQLKEKGYKRLLTFGGPWSNHIHAVAAAGREYNFETVGVIRGEAPEIPSSTLAFAQSCGMHLHFVSRSTYRQRNDEAYQAHLQEKFGPCLILPEGGTNTAGISGASEIPSILNKSFDFIAVPCGTGGTLAGLVQGAQPNTTILGFPVLKNVPELESLLTKTVPDHKNHRLLTGFEAGGFAKVNQELISFMLDFESQHKIPLEPLYNAKSLWGIISLIKQNYFLKGSRILALHTGGLQGKAGMLPLMKKYGYTDQ